MDMKTLTSGKLARAAGVNLETIRYYERQALLPSPPRTAAGYRNFPAESVQRVRFIRRAQTLGFSLKEIKELLAFGNRRRTSCATIRHRAEKKITEIEQKITALNAMKSALKQLADACSGSGPIAHCPILECLNSDEEVICDYD